MAQNQVSVEITLEEKAALKALTQLTKEVQKTETSFQKMGDEGDKSLGLIGEAQKGVSSGFKSLVSGVTVANLASEAIIGTANAIKSFAVESLNAAIEAEESTNKLAQALRASGSYSQQAVEDFQNYAGALAETTIHADDVILSQIALAKSFGASNEQAKQLVKAASELAATYGGSLESRVQQLGKTLTGTGGKLDTLIPGFKALTEEQLKSGAAFEFINSKFSGAAAAQLDSYGGRLNQLKKSFSELQEAIGSIVVESGISSLFESIATSINKFTQSLADSRIESARQKEGFKETEGSVEQLARKYASLTEELTKYETVIERAKEPKNMVNIGDLQIAEVKVKSLSSQLATLYQQIDKGSAQVATVKTPDGKINTNEDPTDEEKKRVQARIDANEALKNAYVELAAWEAEQELMKRTITADNYQYELEQLQGIEASKIEEKYKSEELKAQAIADGTVKRLTLEKLEADKTLAIKQSAVAAETKLKEKQKADEERINQMRLSATGNFLAAGLALTKQGSREQQALSIANATVSTYEAATNALATKPFLPLGLSSFALAMATGFANVRSIASQKFEFGGVVDGKFNTGDKQMVGVNAGEMILTRSMQNNLIQDLKNGGSGGNVAEALDRLSAAILSQPIQVNLDSRKIAEGVRTQVQQGFRLG